MRPLSAPGGASSSYQFSIWVGEQLDAQRVPRQHGEDFTDWLNQRPKKDPASSGAKVGDPGEIAQLKDSFISPIFLATLTLNGSRSLFVTPILIPAELFVAADLN